MCRLYQSLTAVLITLLLSLSLSLSFSSLAAANTFKSIDLKYRDADSLLERLQPLVEDSIKVSADGNRLLVAGPDAEVKSLLNLIKTLDKPRKQLRVSVYRGANPEASAEAFSDKRWSTDSGKLNNLTDVAVISEDATLLITETELILTTDDSYREGGETIDQNDNTQSNYKAAYNEKSYESLSSGVRLTPRLLKDDQVSVDAIISIPDKTKSSDEKNLRLATTQVTRVVNLNQWVLIANATKLSQRSALMENRQIFSTQKKGEIDDSIWVKIELIKN